MASPLPEKIEAYLEGHVSGQVVVGHQNTVIHAAAGAVVTVAERPVAPRLRPLPVLLRPRPFPGLLDREREIGAATTALDESLPLDVHGPPGLGKTSLLRYLAHQAPHPSLPDGIVYLSARRQTPEDLQQALFEALWETDAPFRPEAVWLRHALQQRRALVLLDDVDVPREEIEALLDLAPRCVFVLAASERRLWGEMRGVALAGLPVDAALELLERELGRPLAPEERSSAERLATALEGHPLRLLQAAARVREEGLSLEEMERQVASSTAAALLVAQARAREPERRLLAVLATVGGGALRAETLEALAQVPGASPLLAALTARGLVEPHDGGFRLSGELGRVLEETWDLSPWREKVAAHFGAATEVPLDEVDAVHGLLDRTLADGRFPEALGLARSVEGVLFRSVRWGSWALVLEAALRAAEAQQDRAAQAWCLHQLGSRALVLGEAEFARRALSQALRLRESLGAELEAAITRHNLDLLVGAVPESAERQPRTTTPRGLPAPFKWLLAALVPLLIGLGAWRLWPRPDVPQQNPLSDGETTTSDEVTTTPLDGGPGPTTPDGTPTPTPTPGEGTTTTGDGATTTTSSGGTAPTPDETPTPTPTPAMVPHLVLSTTSLDFGQRLRGATVEGKVTIANHGTAPLRVGAVRLTDDGAGFVARGGACSGRTLPVGDECTVLVSFRPVSEGRREARLTITANAAGGPWVVRLAGTGTAGHLRIEPAELGFERQRVGTRSKAKDLTVRSVGGAPVDIGAVTLQARGNAFALSEDCSRRTLSQGEHCTLRVGFTPDREGALQGEIRIPHDAAGDPGSVPLAGEGAAPRARIEPQALDFDSAELDTRRKLQTVRVESVGTWPLEVKVLLPSEGPFRVRHDCAGREIAPGEACEISVSFLPRSAETFRATLQVEHSGDDTPYRVTLSGSATPRLEPGVRWEPQGLDFGELELKGKEVQNWVIVSSVGSAPLKVWGFRVDDKASGFSYVKDSCSPGEVAPNKGCDIVVRFQPERPGKYSGELRFETNAPGSPHRVPLSAQVVGTPEVSWKPRELDFGTHQPSDKGRELTLSMFSVGEVSLSVGKISQSGAPSFTVVADGCSHSTLAPGMLCTVVVRFVPGRLGEYSGELEFKTNAPGSPPRVKMSARVEAPQQPGPD